MVAIVLAAAVLAAAVVSVTMPLADRHTVTMVHGGRPRGGRAGRWCKGVLIAALATLVISALVSGWTDQQHDRQPGALPGLPGSWPSC